MTCESARQGILTADPAELEPGRHTELGQHLLGCAECRRAAALVITDTNALAHSLRIAPRRSPEEALRALAQPRSRALPRVAPWAAAAAIIAALILWQTRDTPLPPQPATAHLPQPPSPVVEDAGGANVALFTTTDPDIVVVWLY